MSNITNQMRIDSMLKNMKEVEVISPTLCTAKWLQSTIYLMTGFTHSCHHPATHKIPLEELKTNPTALHNTKYKKEQRLKMLNGERPSECDYCWNIEDLKNDHISDRVYKSAEPTWSMPYLDAIKENREIGNIKPTYLEVAFDNTCNFKCAYCTPDISSKWMEEIKQHGPYPTSTKTGNLDYLIRDGRMPIPNREYNPYVEAFWKWWPELYETLDTFRITGGEPLLSKNTWKVFDYVIKQPRKELTLAINSNMDVPETLITKLIESCNKIAPNIKTFELYTSCEAVGNAAEYIRYGMKYDKFMSNIERFLTETNCRVNMMITFNALSVTTFKDFLNDIWTLRTKYNEADSDNRIPIMIAYLRWPKHISARILPQDIKEKYSNIYKEFVNSHTKITSSNSSGRFYLEEVDQINRLCEFMMGEPDTLIQDKKDFALYFDEYDIRRNTNFDTTFPELVKFKSECIKKRRTICKYKGNDNG